MNGDPALPMPVVDLSAATRPTGRAGRLASAVAALRRLPCAARKDPVVLSLSKDAQLPAFTALTPVRHSQRVSPRSALRARSPNPVLLGASDARPARPVGLVAGAVVPRKQSSEDAVAGKAAGGAWVGRICAAEKRRWVGRARSALRALTCGRLSERSERSERSEFDHRAKPPSIAGHPQRSAGQASEPHPGPARRLACATRHGSKSKPRKRDTT